MSKKKVYKFNGCTISIKEVKWFDEQADKKKDSYVSAKAIEPIISNRDKTKDICSKQNSK